MSKKSSTKTRSDPLTPTKYFEFFQQQSELLHKVDSRRKNLKKTVNISSHPPLSSSSSSNSRSASPSYERCLNLAKALINSESTKINKESGKFVNPSQQQEVQNNPHYSIAAQSQNTTPSPFPFDTVGKEGTQGQQNHQSNPTIGQDRTMTDAKADLQADFDAANDQLQFIKDQIDDHPETSLTLQQINVLLDDINELCNNVRDMRSRTYRLYHAAARQPHVTAVTTLKTSLNTAKAAASTIQADLLQQQQQQQLSTQIQLPPLRIPKFEGTFGSWTSFLDQFTSFIHNNKTQSAATKLQHLVSLTKDAVPVVGTYQFTDGNYPIVLDYLKNRFSHERETFNSHFKKLFNIPTLNGQSSPGLQTILDTTTEVVRSMEIHGVNLDKGFKCLIVYMIFQRLDFVTKRDLESSFPDDKYPTLDTVKKFIETRARALSVAPVKEKPQQPNYSNQSSTKENPQGEKSQNKQINNNNTTTEKKFPLCAFCSDPHYIGKCQDFKNLPVTKRFHFIKDKKHCVNCLSSKHATLLECKNPRVCTIKVNNVDCGKRHHPLLHNNNFNKSQQHTTTSENISSHNATGTMQKNKMVLLGTALVDLKSPSVTLTARLLLDGGSQCNLISEDAVQKLKLSRINSNQAIHRATGEEVGIATGTTTLTIVSRAVPNWSQTITAYIVKKVSTTLPQKEFDPSEWKHIHCLTLADPTFSTPRNLDLLIGAGVYNDILMDKRIKGEPGTPSAQQTTLGYVLSGTVNNNPSSTPIISNVITEVEPFDLTKFWEMGEISPTTKIYSKEEKLCLDFFKNTHQRTEDGRYQVNFPFKPNAPALGISRPQAVRRWLQVEKRFQKNPERQKQYHAFMQEYLDLRHMRPVPKERMNISPQQHYYLPHHFVCKDSSSTTKLRVVFDGGAVTSTGVSLNDILMNPPVIQRPLWDILLSWRLYFISVKGDAEKLYRQFIRKSPDQNFQRIVYREDPSKPMIDYELTTVTPGTKSAGGEATACLNQLAKDERKEFPVGATSIEEEYFIDDFMGGGHSLKEAIQKYNEVTKITQKAKINMRKWSSSSKEILKLIPAEKRENEIALEIGKCENVKALGLLWNPDDDNFEFKFNFDTNNQVTMRAVLSNVARVWDPIGFLAPVTMILKIFMKDLHALKIGWDSFIPEHHQRQWNILKDSLADIKKIRIPRYVKYFPSGRIILHGFSDGSEKGMASSIYLIVIREDGTITSYLIASKTRVAPERNVSIPRLELGAALLLTLLMIAVKAALKIQIEKTYYWTDSSIVLHWLQKPANTWKTFVANRVSQIQEHTNPKAWFHVKSEENAADCASRGLTASELINFDLWWSGPSWLTSGNLPTGPIPGSTFTEEELEIRRNKLSFHTIATTISNGILESLSTRSSWFTTKKVAAYLLRASHNFKNTNQKINGPLSVREINNGEILIIKFIQQKYFSEELKYFKDKQKREEEKKQKLLLENSQEPIEPIPPQPELSFPKGSPLLQLSPFLDNHGVIRVGGRIERAKISENRKHPIILPRKHHIINLIIEHYHKSFLHGGNQLVQAHLTGKYYILHSKHTIRQVIRKCVTCTKFNSETSTQLMADLPTARVTPSRCFSYCGVDFAGPYSLKNPVGRKPTIYKGYIALFICYSTRAIHVEAASSLSTEGFLQVFRRFISRRGLPTHIYSDCGTNFEGSANELMEQQKLVEQINEDSIIKQEMLKRNINWHFLAPASPHHGCWEVGVKLIKHHIRRTISGQPLTFEEFSTLLTSCEAMVNSRPLSSLTTNPDDLEPLTPAHFLIGSSLTDPPEVDLLDVKLNRLSRFQLLQRKKQEFWARWTQDYLSRLQNRPKWMTPQPNFQPGDLVILKEDNLPPKEWRLARITQVHPGSDERVRIVTLKLKGGYDKKGKLFYTTLKRPVVKIIALPEVSSE